MGEDGVTERPAGGAGRGGWRRRSRVSDVWQQRRRHGSGQGPGPGPGQGQMSPNTSSSSRMSNALPRLQPVSTDRRPTSRLPARTISRRHRLTPRDRQSAERRLSVSIDNATRPPSRRTATLTMRTVMPRRPTPVAAAPYHSPRFALGLSVSHPLPSQSAFVSRMGFGEVIGMTGELIVVERRDSDAPRHRFLFERTSAR